MKQSTKVYAAKVVLTLIGYAGIGLALWGVWRIYPPAALIVGGLVLLAFAAMIWQSVFRGQK